ncbi:MAG: OmpA family protein, partial [Flavobacteriaceae bacterium]|nr:OmpA family protein [Flavobacteriaceae bacterium]
MKKLLAVAIISSILFSSCVSQKKYTELDNRYKQTSQELVDTKANLMKCLVERDKSDFKVTTLESRIAELQQDKAKGLEQVGDLTVLTKAASENIKETLAQLSKKDEYIKHIQKALTAKDSLNLALAVNLKSVLKNGLDDEDIEINVEKTVVYISIADKLLFKSGSHIVSDKAKTVLGKVAQVVAAKPNVEVMVEGYTDSNPINTECINDNWDLSVKRATSVVRVLQNDHKIDPKRLVAAGRSEFLPLDTNKTAEGRSKNRRTRIVLIPKLDQFFTILEEKN